MKKIMVTGGSGGIGRAIVSELSGAGFDILNLDIAAPAETFPGETRMAVDFRNPQKFSAILERLKKESWHGIVHSAGYGGPYQEITEISLQDYNDIMNINLTSFYQLLNHILPGMKQNKAGRVVAISSILGSAGSALSTVYSTAKHGIIGMVRSVADEAGKYGITVNAVSPGFVATKMGVQNDQVSDHEKKIINRTPAGKIAKPEEIARVVMFLLDEKSDYINGADWVVDGGISAGRFIT